MKIGFVIFDGMTALDFVGAFDPLTRLKTMGFIPELTWEINALSQTVQDGTGLVMAADRVAESLSGYDLVLIPGGFATRRLVRDQKFIEWIRTAADAKIKASVCTGSLLWGAAGFLANKKATTHPGAYDLLKPFCATVVDDRVVDEGDIITSRGVTAAIDLGLYLCGRLAGAEAREKIRRQMDYQ